VGYKREVIARTVELTARADNRRYDELRDISIERGVNRYAEGSALIRWGDTVVNCTASVENKVPPFLRGLGSGWVSAEYSMLPRATQERNQRDVSRGKLSGRSSEIQRLIGRSIRAAVDFALLGERTILIDCDVLQASGGTRTASITVSFVCLVDALRTISAADCFDALPLTAQVAAVSVGMVDGSHLLDLSYDEDHVAEVDCNVVMTSAGEFVELQGTGERSSFSKRALDQMLSIAESGLKRVFQIQRDVLDLSETESALFDAYTSRKPKRT
jgi:ribonuclease PH